MWFPRPSHSTTQQTWIMNWYRDANGREVQTLNANLTPQERRVDLQLQSRPNAELALLQAGVCPGALHSRGVPTVSEMDRFAQTGCMISLINVDALRRARTVRKKAGEVATS